MHMIKKKKYDINNNYNSIKKNIKFWTKYVTSSLNKKILYI